MLARNLTALIAALIVLVAALIVRQAFTEKTQESHRLAAQLDRATAAAERAQTVTACTARLGTTTALLAIQVQSAAARWQIAQDPLKPTALAVLTAVLDQQDTAIRDRDQGLRTLAAGGTPPQCAPQAESPSVPR